METKKLLTDQEVTRIKAEELLRHQIREDLKPEKKNKTIEFLNSNFGLWLLSTVAIGIITWSYSSWRDHKKSIDENRVLISKLDAEITNRIEEDKALFSRATTIGNYDAAVNSFVSYTSSQPLFDEFKNDNLKSLLIKLSTLLDDEKEKSEVKAAIHAISEVKNIYRLPTDITIRGQLQEPIRKDQIAEKEKIKNLFLQKFDTERWK